MTRRRRHAVRFPALAASLLLAACHPGGAANDGGRGGAPGGTGGSGGNGGCRGRGGERAKGGAAKDGGRGGAPGGTGGSGGNGGSRGSGGNGANDASVDQVVTDADTDALPTSPAAVCRAAIRVQCERLAVCQGNPLVSCLDF